MEHWEKTYTSDVDIYEAFCAAFDPEGTVWHRVLETVPFAGKTVLEIGCGLVLQRQLALKAAKLGQIELNVA